MLERKFTSKLAEGFRKAGYWVHVFRDSGTGLKPGDLIVLATKQAHLIENKTTKKETITAKDALRLLKKHQVESLRTFAENGGFSWVIVAGPSKFTLVKFGTKLCKEFNNLDPLITYIVS